MTSYESLRPELKTGDLVLMGGSSIFSRAIRMITKSKWSHVGMVMRIDDYDMLLLWESMTNGTHTDVLSGTVKRGVQLVPLSKRVRDYDGNLAFRRLSRPLDGERTRQLVAFRNTAKNRGYDFDGLELLRSALDEGVFWSNREDLSAYFCSELVAETLQAIGILDQTAKASNEYTPNDFSTDAPTQLPLVAGFAYDPEIWVRDEPSQA